MAKMQLFGGEKDGMGQDGELSISSKDRPDVFYAVPNLDEDKIKKTRGNDAKREMRDRLAILAYKFDPTDSDDKRYKMKRAPELDKVRQG